MYFVCIDVIVVSIVQTFVFELNSVLQDVLLPLWESCMVCVWNQFWLLSVLCLCVLQFLCCCLFHALQHFCLVILLSFTLLAFAQLPSLSLMLKCALFRILWVRVVGRYEEECIEDVCQMILTVVISIQLWNEVIGYEPLALILVYPLSLRVFVTCLCLGVSVPMVWFI